MLKVRERKSCVEKQEYDIRTRDDIGIDVDYGIGPVI